MYTNAVKDELFVVESLFHHVTRKDENLGVRVIARENSPATYLSRFSSLPH